MDKTWIRHVLKGTATWKANESKMYALIKPCNLPQTQSNLNEKLESSHFWVTSHSPNWKCINRRTSFPLLILTLFAILLIILMKICTVWLNLEFYWLFKNKFTGSWIDIQNGDHHWLIRSQNFDFRISITFLFYIPLWSGFRQIAWFNKDFTEVTCFLFGAIIDKRYYK